MPRFYVGPSWPASIAAYNYVLVLPASDIAWEFLRRNAQYQRAYHLSRRGSARASRLRSGHLLVRVRRHTLRSIAWGLHPFRRSGFAGSPSVALLAHERRGAHP